MNNSDKVFGELLAEREKNIKEKIAKVEKKIESHKLIVPIYERQLFMLQSELEKVQEEKQLYEPLKHKLYGNSVPLRVLDSYEGHRQDKVEAIKDQIAQLEEIKKGLSSESSIRRVSLQIKIREDKLKKLEKKTCRLSRAQKHLIVTKSVFRRLKNKAISFTEGSADYFDEKRSVSEMQKEIVQRDTSGIKDKALGTVYGLSEKHSIKKEEKHEKVLEQLENRHVGLIGANLIVTRRSVADKLRSAKSAPKKAASGIKTGWEAFKNFKAELDEYVDEKDGRSR